MLGRFLLTVFHHPLLSLAAWLAVSVIAGILIGKMIRWGTE